MANETKTPEEATEAAPVPEAAPAPAPEAAPAPAPEAAPAPAPKKVKTKPEDPRGKPITRGGVTFYIKE